MNFSLRKSNGSFAAHWLRTVGGLVTG